MSTTTASRGPVDPRLLRRSQATRGSIAALVGIGVLQAAAMIGQAWLLAHVVADLVGGGVLADQTPRLAGLVAVFAGRALLVGLQQWVAFRASAAVKSQLRHDLLAARLDRPLGDTSAGRLTALVDTGVEALDGWFSGYLPQLVLAVVVPGMLGIAIGLSDPTSLLIVVCTLPLIPGFMILIGLVTRDRLDAGWRAQARLAHHFADLLSGLPTLQVFGRARGQQRGLRRVERRSADATMRTLRVAFLSSLVLEVLATLSVALIAVAIGLRVVDDELSLVVGLFVLVLAPEVYLPLRQVGARYHDAADGMAAAEDAFALIDAPAPVPGGSTPVPERAAVEWVDLTLARGGRTVAEVPDLVLGPGQVLAVGGPSGAGKSTLLQVLLGELAPASGRVLIGGVELSELDREAWRRAVAWVGQEPLLIAGTVADNVALDVPGAPPGRVRAALDAAGADDLDLEQAVLPDGSGLSAGQQRRVAVARALLAVDCGGARVMVLDEPSAGLDAATETTMLHGLLHRLRDWEVTAIVVSHRPAVLAAADQVLSLTPFVPAPAAPAPDPAFDSGMGASTPELRSQSDHSGVRAGEGGTGAQHDGPEDDWPQGRTGLGAQLPALLFGVGAASAAVALMATSGWLLARASEHPPVLFLLVATVGVRAFGLSRGVLRYCERLFSHRVGLAAAAMLRLRSYAALAEQPMIGRRLGDLVSRLTGDVLAAQDRLVRVRLPIVVGALVGIAAVVAMAIWAPLAAVATAALVLGCALVWPALAAAWTRRAERAIAPLRAEIVDQAWTIHRLAPVLGRGGSGALALQEATRRDLALRRSEQRAALGRGLAQAAGLLTLGVVVAVAIAAGAERAAAGMLAPIMIAVLALTPLAVHEVLMPLVDAHALRERSEAALARVRALDDLPAAPAAAVSGLDAPGIDLSAVVIGRQEALLAPLDLTVGAGERVLLVGPSGVGKSTLLATLLGQLPALDGTVATGGRIGCLTQDAHVFDTTVEENLRIGDPTADRAALLAAEHAAGLELPLSRRVGEHGTALSGGEARRVALARVLVGDPQTLLLDEPTEHLDRDTAIGVLRDIDRLWPDAPILAVSHQPELFLECWPGVRVVELVALGERVGGAVPE